MRVEQGEFQTFKAPLPNISSMNLSQEVVVESLLHRMTMMIRKKTYKTAGPAEQCGV